MKYEQGKDLEEKGEAGEISCASESALKFCERCKRVRTLREGNRSTVSVALVPAESSIPLS